MPSRCVDCRAGKARRLAHDRSPCLEINEGPAARRRLRCVFRHAAPATGEERSFRPPDRAAPKRRGSGGSRGCPSRRHCPARTLCPRRSPVASQIAVRCLVVVGGARPCVVCGSAFRQVPGHRCRSGWCAGRSVVSPSFGLTRPLRPRFGLSDRRPSSLRSVSISSPQRPFSAFFPWSLRAHSSRDKKASPWPSSTALRPFGCGPIASGQRQPSRSRWSRPEKRKRTRIWLPSATSP